MEQWQEQEQEQEQEQGKEQEQEQEQEHPRSKNVLSKSKTSYLGAGSIEIDQYLVRVQAKEESLTAGLGKVHVYDKMSALVNSLTYYT